jgi:hypothetical protein
MRLDIKLCIWLKYVEYVVTSSNEKIKTMFTPIRVCAVAGILG